MSYATLIVQLELGCANEAVLGITENLARRMGAAVIGVGAARPIALVVGEGYFPDEIMREDIDCIEQQGKVAEEEFRKEMSGLPGGAAWDMEITDQSIAGHVAAKTGPADLVVVGVAQEAEQATSSTRRVDLDDLIMRAGRPVLVVPRAIDHFDFRCALVAWTKSREARRALSDALPLLRLMDRVVIAEITERGRQGDVQADLDKMVAWLHRQGVIAVSRTAIAAGEDGERLVALADEEKAELIVAGAYGHSRFREWVLGGTTRHMLRHGGRCLLLSH